MGVGVRVSVGVGGGGEGEGWRVRGNEDMEVMRAERLPGGKGRTQLEGDAEGGF